MIDAALEDSKLKGRKPMKVEIHKTESGQYYAEIRKGNGCLARTINYASKKTCQRLKKAVEAQIEAKHG